MSEFVWNVTWKLTTLNKIELTYTIRTNPSSHANVDSGIQEIKTQLSNMPESPDSKKNPLNVPQNVRRLRRFPLSTNVKFAGKRD